MFSTDYSFCPYEVYVLRQIFCLLMLMSHVYHLSTFSANNMVLAGFLGVSLHLLNLCTPFYPRDAMLTRVFATATCPSVCLSHAGIVPSRAKAGSWNVHHLIAPWQGMSRRKIRKGSSQRNVPNEGGLGFFRRVSTNMSSYLENGEF